MVVLRPLLDNLERKRRGKFPRLMRPQPHHTTSQGNPTAYLTKHTVRTIASRSSRFFFYGTASLLARCINGKFSEVDLRQRTRELARLQGT
jgi:hypothetical protein